MDAASGRANSSNGSADSSDASSGHLRAWAPGHGVIAALLFVAVIGLQVLVGAYRSERGLYSDEAAHMMNGLVLRDYVYSGFASDPLTFARDYYQHYPKIAPFMWPPLFHGLLGIWLLPGWPPEPATIALLGIFTTWTAWRLYTIVSMFASIPIALGAVGFFVVTPTVVSLSSSVMVDIVIAALAIESTYWLSRYFTTSARRDAVIFGLMAACGCLAKGNGVAIVLVPLVLLALTGHYRILSQSGLYLAAAIVVVLAVPLLSVSFYLDAAIGDFGPLSLALVWERTLLYAVHLSTQIGVAALALAAVGAGTSLIPRLIPSSAGVIHSRGLVALVTAGWVFHLLSPHLVSDPRYITLIFAPLYGLAGLGVMTACGGIRSNVRRWATQLAIFGVLTALHFIERPTLSAQVPLGYGAVAVHLGAERLAGSRVLVVSDELGEGAGVVEIAVMDLTPRPAVIRGSKLLASDDWMGRNFRLRYDSADSILAELEAMHVDYVILDSSPQAQRLDYWPLMHTLVTTHSDRVQRLYGPAVDSTRGPARPLDVYRLMTRAPGSPKPLSGAAINLPVNFWGP